MEAPRLEKLEAVLNGHGVHDIISAGDGLFGVGARAEVLRQLVLRQVARVDMLRVDALDDSL